MSSNGSSDINSSSTSVSNASNSFYASFKIYINKFSGGTTGAGQQNDKTSPAATPTNKSDQMTNNAATNFKQQNSYYSASSSPTKIVRIERIECDDDDCNDDNVFLDNYEENEQIEQSPA